MNTSRLFSLLLFQGSLVKRIASLVLIVALISAQLQETIGFHLAEKGWRMKYDFFL